MKEDQFAYNLGAGGEDPDDPRGGPAPARQHPEGGQHGLEGGRRPAGRHPAHPQQGRHCHGPPLPGPGLGGHRGEARRPGPSGGPGPGQRSHREDCRAGGREDGVHLLLRQPQYRPRDPHRHGEGEQLGGRERRVRRVLYDGDADF